MKSNEGWKTLVRSRLSFDVSPSRVNLPPTENPPTYFRDPAVRLILGEIAKSLRTKGYSASEPQPAKGCFTLRTVLSRFELTVMLSLERQEDRTRFRFWSNPTKKAFRKAPDLAPSDISEWDRFCDVIEMILDQEFGASSIQRTTHDEVFGHDRPGAPGSIL
jgi:hypothetical protein